jgi:hypothetical protein
MRSTYKGLQYRMNLSSEIAGRERPFDYYARWIDCKLSIIAYSVGSLKSDQFQFSNVM